MFLIVILIFTCAETLNLNLIWCRSCWFCRTLFDSQDASFDSSDQHKRRKYLDLCSLDHCLSQNICDEDDEDEPSRANCTDDRRNGKFYRRHYWIVKANFTYVESVLQPSRKILHPRVALKLWWAKSRWAPTAVPMPPKANTRQTGWK